jgi:8-oxo-dGTP pyrophosphatase MutT (NUDIX family)
VDDPNLLHTAVRETEEETGLDLRATGIPLGRLDEVAPATRRLPPISIHPFVFGVPGETEARVASREVNEVLWTPMDLLKDPAVSDTVDVPRDGESRLFPCFRVEGRVIWGLTYRILTRFIEIVPDLPPIRQ